MSQVCPSCRGNDFQEVDDELYCATPGCGIRIGGQKTVSDVFQGTEIRLTQEVKAASSRTKGRQDGGIAWTTYEAFNLIIIHQVDFLVKECGAPNRLRQVVLALWATFLAKSEVAFVDDSEEVSKLPFTSRQRDVALIAKELPEVPKLKRPKSTVKLKRSKRFRIGSKYVVKHSTGEKPAPESEPEETEVMSTGNSETSVTLSSNASELEKEMIKDIGAQDHDIQVDNVPVTESEQGKELDLGGDIVMDADEDHPVKSGTKKKRKSVVRVPPVEKSLPLVLEEHEMNSRSQEMYVSFRGKKQSDYRYHPEYIDYMDLRTTLAFILIAARFIDYDVYVTDLIRWIDQGFLVYFSCTRLFPDDWFLQARDHQTFCPNSSPYPEAILHRCSKLIRYLEVPSLVPVDMFRLIRRFLDDMNLPIGMMHVIQSKREVVEVICKIGHYRWGNKQIFRFNEVQAVAIIIITLRKIFGSDQQVIKSFCDKIRKLPGSSHYFCFDEWIEATKLRVLALKRHYTPLFGECESEICDPRVVVDFHDQVVRKWRFLANGVSRDDPGADHELVRLFRKLDCSVDERTAAQFPCPSMKFLTDASDFVKDRLDNNPFIQHILSINFRLKSLDYMTSGSIFSKIPYVVITPRGSQKWDTILEDLPSEIKLLLQLASWMLHMSPVQLLPELKKVEKLMFPDHYPDSRTRKSDASSASKSTNKKKHVAAG